jgi:hypothetical protein
MKSKARGIKGALTRKIGPLPAWVWAIVGFGLVWYYRSKLSAGSQSGTGTGSVAPTPVDPQPGQVLQPGESYYDPNTGAMSTAPGGGNGGGTPSDYSGLVDGITAAIAAGEAATAGSSGGTGPASTGGSGAGTPPPKKRGRGKPPKLTAKGALRAPFGHKKPAAKKGFTTKGLGKGFWEYVPVKRTPKPKNQHGPKAKTTKPPKPGTKSKPRSTATTKATTGGRTTARGKKPLAAKGKVRGAPQANASVPRAQSTKRTTPVVTPPVVRQRPVASTQPRRPAPVPSTHRTASTPPRTASRTKTTARKR